MRGSAVAETPCSLHRHCPWSPCLKLAHSALLAHRPAVAAGRPHPVRHRLPAQPASKKKMVWDFLAAAEDVVLCLRVQHYSSPCCRYVLNLWERSRHQLLINSGRNFRLELSGKTIKARLIQSSKFDFNRRKLVSLACMLQLATQSNERIKN